MRISILAMIAVVALPLPAMAQVAREPVEQKVPAPGATATPTAPDDPAPTSTEARQNERAAPGEAVPTNEAPALRPPVEQPVPPADDPTKR
jgi:hypothetical protein